MGVCVSQSSQQLPLPSLSSSQPNDQQSNTPSTRVLFSLNNSNPNPSIPNMSATVASVPITIAGEFKANSTGHVHNHTHNHDTNGTKYNAIAAMNASDPLQHYSYVPQAPLGEHDVEIKVAACGMCYTYIMSIPISIQSYVNDDNGAIGVCHSDIHQVKKFARSYPFVAGHEVIGEVIAKGSAVTLLEIGQRVGIGCQTNSCGTCRECTRGMSMSTLTNPLTLTRGYL
jgi:hypothetical protein